MSGSTVAAPASAVQSVTSGASSPGLSSVAAPDLKKGGLGAKGAMHSTHILDCPRDGLVFVELDGDKPRCPECGKYLADQHDAPFGTGWGDGAEGD